MKLLGAFVVAAAAFYIGQSIHKAQKNYIKLMDEISYAMRFLAAEIGSGKLTTPRAFASLAEKLAPPARSFFQEISKRMDELGELSFSQIWEQNMQLLGELRERDLYELTSLGSLIGSYGAEEEREHFFAAEAYFRQAAERERKHAAENGKLYFFIPLSLASLVIIVLI